MPNSRRRSTRTFTSEHAPVADLAYEPADAEIFAGDPFDNPFDDAPVAPPAPPAKTTKPPAKATKPPAETMQELAERDMAVFFGAHGPLSQQLEGYELRASQVEMAQAVKKAILEQRHALIEAPTGTGKSIAYLVPAILSGKTVVVATANKSLQSQLYWKDLPFLRKVLGRDISAVVVKGRSNFICTHKWENENFEQQRFRMYDREHDQIAGLRKWLDETDTGDVDDLPFMLDGDLRGRVVSYPDDCLHDDCSHYDDACWVNLMRDRAAQAQVLITNHHLLLNALELGYAGERILPPAPIYIIDEAHSLEQTATGVYETVVTDYVVEQLASRTLFKQHVGDDESDELRYHNTLAFQDVAHQSRENSFRVEGDLEEMKKLSRRLSDLGQKLKKKNPYSDKNKDDGGAPPAMQRKRAEERRSYELLIEAVNSAATKLMTVASSKNDGAYVRYATRIFDRRHISLEIHAAPIDPAALLAQHLFHPESKDDDEPVERTVICTSATLAAGGHFAHFKARCGVRGETEERVLPAVFDYPNQALLYQPALPAYDYRNADAFYTAAGQEIARLLEASRGRALCLFTAWSGLQRVAEHLRSNSASRGAARWPIRAQGDAPRDALLTWFRETPYSVLLATRSFWEGVDIPGDDLSLVVVDKMPFPTPGDPLHSARMKAIDDAGRSSFNDYMTPLMTLALKQGFGRLIRRSTDRGVVAILDERLTSKGYGRQARADLPPARFSRDFKDVHHFFQQALDSQAEFALNVWAMSNGEVKAAPDETAADDSQLGSIPARSSLRVSYRWQLLRLQDGKADEKEGVIAGESIAVGEIASALEGLTDLRRRIQQAGRQPADFSVEVRWSKGPAELGALQTENPQLWQAWNKEQISWRSVHLLQVESHP